MKITLSKSQWEKIGKKAGWMKVAQFGASGLDKKNPNYDKNKAGALSRQLEFAIRSLKDASQACKQGYSKYPQNEVWGRVIANLQPLQKTENVIIGEDTGVEFRAVNTSITGTINAMTEFMQSQKPHPNPQELQQTIDFTKDELLKAYNTLWEGAGGRQL